MRKFPKLEPLTAQMIANIQRLSELYDSLICVISPHSRASGNPAQTTNSFCLIPPVNQWLSAPTDHEFNYYISPLGLNRTSFTCKAWYDQMRSRRKKIGSPNQPLKLGSRKWMAVDMRSRPPKSDQLWSSHRFRLRLRLALGRSKAHSGYLDEDVWMVDDEKSHWPAISFVRLLLRVFNFSTPITPRKIYCSAAWNPWTRRWTWGGMATPVWH